MLKHFAIQDEFTGLFVTNAGYPALDTNDVNDARMFHGKSAAANSRVFQSRVKAKRDLHIVAVSISVA